MHQLFNHVSAVAYFRTLPFDVWQMWVHFNCIIFVRLQQSHFIQLLLQLLLQYHAVFEL